jgi:hypothetical protein
MRPSRKLPTRLLAGETVVVDPRGRKLFLMNKVGAAIWGAVERGASAGEMVDELVRRFRVEADQARGDVDRFLGALEQGGLAVRAEDL